MKAIEESDASDSASPSTPAPTKQEEDFPF